MKMIFISLLLLLLSSCASTTSKNMITAEYQKKLLAEVEEPLPQRPANFGEVFDTQAQNARIILVDEQPSEHYRGVKKQLMALLSQSVNLRLGKLSGVVVKNDLPDTLKNEIMLSESNGNEIGRQDIDFALYMGISAYTSDKTAEKKEKMFTDGSYFDCGVEAEVYGWFRLVEIPSMRVIQQIEFNEDESESRDLDSSARCYQRIYDNLFIEAHKEITDSIACDAVEDMKSHLKPIGHVLRKNIAANEVVYKTSLTSLQGVEKGDTIEFLHTKNGNSYAEGKIIKVTSTDTLIRLVTLAENETVFAHDFVKVANNSALSLSCIF